MVLNHPETLDYKFNYRKEIYFCFDINRKRFESLAEGYSFCTISHHF